MTIRSAIRTPRRKRKPRIRQPIAAARSSPAAAYRHRPARRQACPFGVRTASTTTRSRLSGSRRGTRLTLKRQLTCPPLFVAGARRPSLPGARAPIGAHLKETQP